MAQWEYQLMFVDALFEMLKSGGWVLIPILLVGAAGFYLVGLTMAELGREFYRRSIDPYYDNVIEFVSNGKINGAENLLKKRKGLVSQSLSIAVEKREMNEIALRGYLSKKLEEHFSFMDRHFPMITILAAVAPLLGLLGTVSGMVHTFEIITEYGNSNPILLADGISEALITTQSGLLIAFPLLLFKHYLQDNINGVKKRVELRITQFLNSWYQKKQVE